MKNVMFSASLGTPTCFNNRSEQLLRSWRRHKAPPFTEMRCEISTVLWSLLFLCIDNEISNALSKSADDAKTDTIIISRSKIRF